MQVANQGDHFLKCPPLLYSTTSRISAPRREHRSAAPQTNPRWRGWASALVLLPARISRSSWLAGPSCSDVAMFRPEVQNSHWLALKAFRDARLTYHSASTGNLHKLNSAHRSFRAKHRKSSARSALRSIYVNSIYKKYFLNLLKIAVITHIRIVKHGKSKILYKENVLKLVKITSDFLRGIFFIKYS